MNFNPAIFKADKPPPGYIPGIGRGAIGFMTRVDVGPASAAPELGGASAAGAIGKGKSTSNDQKGITGEGMVFDKFSGYSERLFADSAYDADDAEADRIYALAEDRVDEKTKRLREERDRDEVLNSRMDSSRIGHQFQDLRKDLATVSTDEWAAIPEIGDLGARFKKSKTADNYTPVPDSIISGAAGLGDNSTLSVMNSADSEAANVAGTGLKSISIAKEKVLNISLAKVGDSVSKTSTVNSSSYLDSLNSGTRTVITGSATNGVASTLPIDVDISDVKRARLLLQSITTSNPSHGPGWIAAARLEEQTGDLAAARKIIKTGCSKCPDDVDVWLEAVRLLPVAHARSILVDAMAVPSMRSSDRLWIAAAELEESTTGRQNVLRKALTINPRSESLWKAAIAVEDEQGALLMLRRAVECLPLSLDFYCALARLEPSYEKAQAVLNMARTNLPAAPEVWVEALHLEEKRGALAVPSEEVRQFLKIQDHNLQLAAYEAYLHALERVDRGSIEDKKFKLGLPDNSPAQANEEFLITELNKLTNFRTKEARIVQQCDKIARRAFKSLSAAHPQDRNQWYNLATQSEQQGFLYSAQALIRAVGLSVLAEAQAQQNPERAAVEAMHMLISDCESISSSGGIRCTRAMWALLAEHFPLSEDIWLSAAKFISSNPLSYSGTSSNINNNTNDQRGSVASHFRILIQAVIHLPNSTILWLMGAKLMWNEAIFLGKRNAALQESKALSSPQENKEFELEIVPDQVLTILVRKHLQRAFQANPAAESIWLAAVKIEMEAGEFSRAKLLLQRARTSGSSDSVGPRVWIKSAALERNLSLVPNETELEILNSGIKLFPNSWKLWIMKAQRELRSMNYYSNDFRYYPRSDELTNVISVFRRKKYAYSRLMNRQESLPAEKLQEITKKLVLLENEKSKRVQAAVENAKLPVFDEQLKAAIVSARKILSDGLKANPGAPHLWILSAELEEISGINGIARARTLLETARTKMPRNDLLWYHSVLLELRSVISNAKSAVGSSAAGLTVNYRAVEALCARAVQTIPHPSSVEASSTAVGGYLGHIQALEIALLPRVQQRRRAKEILEKNDRNAPVIVGVAHLLFRDRSFAKAQNWYQRALSIDPDYGDYWAWFVMFARELDRLRSSGVDVGVLEDGSSLVTEDIAMASFDEANPSLGFYFQSFAKDPRNFRLPKRDILELTIVALKIQETERKTYIADGK